VIRQFEKLLKDTYKHGYCCCPNKGYNILFYDKTNNFKTYFVDTTGSGNDLLIYTYSFQFSHSVAKSDWSKLLKEGEKINRNEYFTCDLNKARRLYAYTVKNDLPVINSRRMPDEWHTYDGEFKITVSKVGKELTEEEIIGNISKAYPKGKYKIEISGSSKLCGSYKGGDCIWEYTATVYCNKDFYDNFDIYKPKSYYHTLCAEILVLGQGQLLNGLDTIVQKQEDHPFKE
jgi:hypothetical protein